MRIGRVILITACTAALSFSLMGGATTSRASGYDYVQNGGFEDGTEPWATSPNATLDSVDSDVVGPAEGGASGRITLSGTTALVRQTTREGVGPGAYHLSARVRLTNSTTIVQVQYDTIPTTYSDSFDVLGTTSGWASLDRDVSVPGIDALTIKIRVSGSSGDVVYVDDVRFEGAAPVTMTPTPSPSPLPSATEVPPGTPTRTPTGTRTPHAAETAAAEAATPEPTDVAAPIGEAIANGGFEDIGEDGAPAGWRKYGGTLTSDTRAHNGERSARLDSETDSTKWVYETVFVDGGAWYEFGAWVAAPDSGAKSALLRISWYANGDGSGSAIGTDDSTESVAGGAGWTSLTTGSVQAPPEARTAKLRIVLAPAGGASTYLLADDATFGPAEPAASAEEPAAAGAADTLAGDSNVGGDAGDLPAPRSNAGGTTRSVRGASAQPSGATSRTKSIVINEVMYDPMTTPDADGEWVELYNAGDVAVSLGGWSLADASSNVALSALIIAPHGFAVVAASDAFDDAYADYDGVLVVLGRRIGNSLGNDGDRLTLLDATGATVDAISWGGDASAFEPSIDDVPAGHSIERRVTGADTDRAGDWVDNERPSPGRAIDAVAGGAQLHGGTIQAVPNRVEVLAADGGNGLTWLPWAMFAAAAAALAGVGAWRLAPAVATRLRHQP